jgi:glutamate synthase domain-containing protein 3
MAGGLLILLGMHSRLDGPLVGGYLGTGMHGGEIFVRGEVEPWQCGKEVGVFTATEEDMAGIRATLVEFCEAFDTDIDELLSVPFTKLVPVSHRPYGKLYTYL